eukprot:1979325-Rhodomonas_salina.3
MKLRNVGDKEFDFTCALHTYFCVSPLTLPLPRFPVVTPLFPAALGHCAGRSAGPHSSSSCTHN